MLPVEKLVIKDLMKKNRNTVGCTNYELPTANSGAIEAKAL